MTQRHVIKQCNTELQLQDSSDVQHYYDEVSHIVQKVLTSKMDQQFSSIFESDTDYVIDRLELDLGEIPKQHFSEEFAQRFMVLLAEKTRTLKHSASTIKSQKKQVESETSIKEHSNKPQNDISDEPDEGATESTEIKERSPLELLNYFALNGTLPWWADALDSTLMTSHLKKALQVCPEALIYKTAHWVKARQPMYRLIQHFSDEYLFELASLILPNEQHRELYEVLVKSLNKINGIMGLSTGLGSQDLREKLWFGVLNGLMQVAGNNPDTDQTLYPRTLPIAQRLRLQIKQAFIDEVKREHSRPHVLELKLLKWRRSADEAIPASKSMAKRDLVDVITEELDVPLPPSTSLQVHNQEELLSSQQTFEQCLQWLDLIAQRENAREYINAFAQYLCTLSPSVLASVTERLHEMAGYPSNGLQFGLHSTTQDLHRAFSEFEDHIIACSSESVSLEGVDGSVLHKDILPESEFDQELEDQTSTSVLQQACDICIRWLHSLAKEEASKESLHSFVQYLYALSPEILEKLRGCLLEHIDELAIRQGMAKLEAYINTCLEDASLSEAHCEQIKALIFKHSSAECKPKEEPTRSCEAAPAHWQREFDVCRQWLHLVAKKTNPEEDFNALSQYLGALSSQVLKKVATELFKLAEAVKVLNQPKDDQSDSAPEEDPQNEYLILVAIGFAKFQAHIHMCLSEPSDLTEQYQKIQILVSKTYRAEAPDVQSDMDVVSTESVSTESAEQNVFKKKLHENDTALPPEHWQRQLDACLQWLHLIGKKENPQEDFEALSQHLVGFSTPLLNKITTELMGYCAKAKELSLSITESSRTDQTQEDKAEIDPESEYLITLAKGIMKFQVYIDTCLSKPIDTTHQLKKMRVLLPKGQGGEMSEAQVVKTPKPKKHSERNLSLDQVDSPRPSSIPSEKPQSTEPPSDLSKAIDECYVYNAGLVLLWPFLTRFFGHLGFFDHIQEGEKNTFLNAQARMRAIHILHALVFPPEANTRSGEFLLPLNKILCGVAPEELVNAYYELSKQELDAGTELLEAVIQNASVLQDTSVESFRQLFLRRSGILSQRDGMWLLRIERENQDMLIEKFPWSTQWLKMDWMSSPMRVEW